MQNVRFSKFGRGPRIAHRSYPALPRIRQPLLVRVLRGVDAAMTAAMEAWRRVWDKVLAI